MKKKQGKPGQAKCSILQEIPQACIDETAAVAFLEKQRWGDTPGCPRCGDTNVTKIKNGQEGRNKRFLWRCHGCKQQFTVRIGTVFEDSRIPLRIWCYAFWKACSSKKGVSALQISRECSISYKSALFLMHRIRYAMTEPGKQEKLQGDIEVDETYVGGKPRKHQKREVGGPKLNTGRGTKKIPVLVMVKRGDKVRARVIPNVTGKTMKAAIRDNVHVSSRIITDEYKSYRGVGKEFAGGHETVTHSIGEYVRGDIHTNEAESFFALVKRGFYGTFHAVSKKHLHRYINEFAFRWNTRKITDGERTASAIKGADGKRLMYREPIGKTA